VHESLNTKKKAAPTELPQIRRLLDKLEGEGE